jgi:hypothetical protein
MTQYKTDIQQRVHAENVSKSKKYQPHAYMSLEVSCDKLIALSENSNVKLGEAMIKIVARSLEKVPTSAETLLKIHETGHTDAWDLKTMQMRDITNDKFGKTFKEIYDNMALHDCVALGTNSNSVTASSATLPRNVIAAFSYNNPIDYIGFEDEVIIDTTEAAHPFPDFDRLNNWKTCKRVTVTMTYDAKKLDSEEAGLLMKHIRQCMQEPDLIHL